MYTLIREDFQSQLDAAIDRANQTKRQNEELRDQNNNLLSTLNVKEQELKIANDCIDRLTEEKAEMQRRADEDQATILELRRSLDNMTAELKNTNIQLDETQKQNDLLTRQMQDLRRETHETCESLQAEKTANLDTIADQLRQIRELEQTLNNTNVALNTMEQRALTGESNSVTLTNMLKAQNDLQAKLHQSDLNIRNLKLENSELKRTIDENLMQAKRAADNLTAQINRLTERALTAE